MGFKWLTDVVPAISGVARRFTSSDLRVLLEAGGPPIPMDIVSVRTEQWGDGEPVIVVTLKNFNQNA
jgi:hypothetical protein